MLTREQLLAIEADLKAVPLAELNDVVHIRALTGAEFDRLRKAIQNKKGQVTEQGLMARFVIAGVCDAEGRPLFTGADLESVNGLPLSVLMRLFRAVQDHNGIGDEDTEELVGNSGTTPTSDSGTA